MVRPASQEPAQKTWMASAARALQRLARQLAAAEASRRSTQLPACSGLLHRTLPSLLGDRLIACPFSAQASELASTGEVRGSTLHRDCNCACKPLLRSSRTLVGW